MSVAVAHFPVVIRFLSNILVSSCKKQIAILCWDWIKGKWPVQLIHTPNTVSWKNFTQLFRK